MPLETGGTSIIAGVSPSIKFLFENGYIKEHMTVLDYGAGKIGRNAEFLRENGVHVFAYDPYHGKNVNGWEGISDIYPCPEEFFDVIFSCFVINVVDRDTEDRIINDLKGVNQFHITRNMDIIDMVESALERKDKFVTESFEKYKELSACPSIEDFCYFGTRTRRGFQRIPELIHKGYTLIKKTHGYKIYQGSFD